MDGAGLCGDLVRYEDKAWRSPGSFSGEIL